MPVDLGRFNSTLVYSRTAPIATLLEDLAELRAFDSKQERLLSKWTTVGVLGLLGTFGSFFLIALSQSPKVMAAGPVIIGSFVVMTIVGFSVRIARSKMNLENRRYELAEKVLKFLGRDSRPEGQISVHLDLQRPNIKRKEVRKGKVGPWKVKYYTDPWLRIQGRLLDGTAYRLVATEKHQHRVKTYRSRSGKWKSKSKAKSGTDLNVCVRVKSRRFPDLTKTNVKQVRQIVQLPEWAILKACQVDAPANSERATLVLKSATKVNWSCEPTDGEESPTSGVRWFAMSILSLYQVLNLARGPEKP